MIHARWTGFCRECGNRCQTGSQRCWACVTKRILVPCPRCGTEFWPWANASHARKFCSRACVAATSRDHMRAIGGISRLARGRTRLSPDELARRYQQRAQEERRRYAQDEAYREAALRRAQENYRRNRAAKIAKVMQWKRAHGQSVRLDGWECLGCGAPLPRRRHTYCSDACSRRETKVRERINFAALAKAVHLGAASRDEVISLARAWRELRTARRTINSMYTYHPKEAAQ